MSTRTRLSFMFCIVFLLISLFGCDRDTAKSVPSKAQQLPIQNINQQTHTFLADAVPLHRIEDDSVSLTIWRQYSAQQPTLLLLSNDPMLLPVSKRLRADVANFIASEMPAGIVVRSSRRHPDPLMLPQMTVDAALRNNWFRQIFWALPLRDSESELSVASFRQNLHDNALATEDELTTVTVMERQARGALRGIPFVAAALPNLPAVSGPVLIHIDQSYFQKIYKNEIATPLLPLVFDTLRSLRERKINVLAVTFSYGNLDQRIALDVRYVADLVTQFVEHPEMLDQSMSVNWQRLSNALYLANFFKKDEIRELVMAMDADAPDTAWIKFLLYRSAAEHKQGSEALAYLAQAVSLETAYAIEYLNLSVMAKEKGRPDEALRMLLLASEVFPDNVQIKIQIIRLAANMGENKTALHLLAQLQTLGWSPVYFPDMPKELERFIEVLKGEATHSQKGHNDLSPQDNPK